MSNLSILRYPVILLVLICASCGTALPTIKPYKLDVQQGNVVTSKMLLQLRPGMTQSQVRFIMGTPLIQDSFHGKRWDYVYQLREKGKITEDRRVILDFENGLLKTVRGDVVPTGSAADKTNEGSANTGVRVINPNAKPADKSLLGKLKFWEKDAAELAEEAAALKAKESADLAAKNAAELAKEAASKKNITPTEHATKPPQTEPMKVLPVVEAPAAAAASLPVAAPAAEVAPVKAAPKEVVAPVPVAPPAPATPPVPAAPPVQALEKPSAEVNGSAPKVEAPATYKSPSSMQFDSTLKLAPEDVEPIAKPEVLAPRAGNKTIPKPKDLPAENPPSLFDKMLEKIGF